MAPRWIRPGGSWSVDLQCAAGSQATLHGLGLVVAQGAHHVIVGIHEGGGDDLAFRGVGIPAQSANATKEATAEAAQVIVLGTSLGGGELHPGAVVDQQ